MKWSSPQGSSSASEFVHHTLSRRRALRLEVADGSIQLASVAPFRIVALRDISTGGFAMLTDTPVPLGFRWYFEFRAGDGLAITAPAHSIHCRRAVSPHCGFVSGWAFERNPDLDSALEHLLDALTPGLLID